MSWKKTHDEKRFMSWKRGKTSINVEWNPISEDWTVVYYRKGLWNPWFKKPVHFATRKEAITFALKEMKKKKFKIDKKLQVPYSKRKNS